jgi:hypothetical protein
MKYGVRTCFLENNKNKEIYPSIKTVLKRREKGSKGHFSETFLWETHKEKGWKVQAIKKEID